MYRFGPFAVDPARRVLMRDKETIPVTARAFDVMLALLDRAGQTVGKEELLRAVWHDTIVEEANLSQHIFTIRRLLGHSDREPYIATVPRRGYQFVAPVSKLAVAAAARPTAAPQTPHLPVRLEIPLPEGSLAIKSTPVVAVARDGSKVVFVANDGNRTRLYLRRLDDFGATAITGSEGAGHPFFSPDGQWIGFECGRRLWKIGIEGGQPLALCDVAELRGATWTSRDEIVFAPGPTTGLWRIGAEGGAPVALTTLDFAGGERTHRWPHALPGGEAVIFTIGHAGATSFDEASLAGVNLETGERRLVLRHATDGRSVSGSCLMWARGAAVLAAPFDPFQMHVAGPARIVAHGVAVSATGAAHFGCSASGVLVHVPGEAQTLRRMLVTISRSGIETARHADGDMLEEPRWTADRRAAIVSVRQRSSDLWAYEFERGTLRRLTFEGENFGGIIGPGRESITFSSSRAGGPSDLFLLELERSREPELLVASEFDKVAGSWSPDGKALVFTEYRSDTGADVWLLDLPTERARPLVCTRFNEYAPVFSPDGGHVAYVTDQSGRPEVVVVNCHGATATCQISTDGGTEPMWAKDGGELFYRSGNRLMRVDLSQGVDRASIPTTLFEGDFVPGTVTLANYDVAADAAEFLMVRAGTPPPAASLRVTIGWSAAD